MIESIRIEFKKIDGNTWSTSEYEVLIKNVNYTQFDDSGFEATTHYKSLESGLKSIAKAKELIAKAENNKYMQSFFVKAPIKKETKQCKYFWKVTK